MGSSVTCPTSTCTLVIEPYRATQAEYDALGVIFGAILVAATLIWGGKLLYRMFTDRPES